MNAGINSPLKWIGGKRLLTKTIIPLIPKHICYCEVFSGAAWVLFQKDPAISKVEVLNDLDGELVNFYDVVKNNWRAFVRSFNYKLVSRQAFYRYRNAKLPTD